jgi:hypothetical protein
MPIIVKTIGGLGNQMFQYAFAKSVSRKLGTNFILDVDTSVIHKGLRVHKFCLGSFNTQVVKAEDSDMHGFVWLRRHKKVFNILYNSLRLKKIMFTFYYPEKKFSFDDGVFNQKDGTYFEGFWQTEKYFKDIEDELRKEFKVVAPLSSYSLEISDHIKQVNAVSLHVRRTDYVTHTTTNQFHGVCSPEYYKAAIDYIREKVSSPHFFIFSDDYEWITENFKHLGNQATFIKNGPDKNHEDLTLMSMCKHHIIANSSFSWWGAWLNAEKSKIVIAPKKWHNNAPKINTVDLLPNGWLKF